MGTMAKKIRQLRQDSIISSIKDGLPRGDSLALDRRKSEQMRVYEKWLQETFWPQALRGTVAFLIVVFVLVLLMPTKQVAKKHQTNKNMAEPPAPKIQKDPREVESSQRSAAREEKKDKKSIRKFLNACTGTATVIVAGTAGAYWLLNYFKNEGLNPKLKECPQGQVPTEQGCVPLPMWQRFWSWLGALFTG